MKPFAKHTLEMLIASAVALAVFVGACSSGGNDSSSDAVPVAVAGSSDRVSSASTTDAVLTASAETDQPDSTDMDSVELSAPGTEESSEGTAVPLSATTDAAPVATTASSVPTVEPETSGTSEPTGTTTTSTTTTASPPTTTSTTTTTAVVSPVVLQVQVLNGSGVAGAAGRLTDRLSEAGYAVLPAGNAAQRYASSAVYFADGWRAEAEDILEAADIEEVEEVTAMPQQFASNQAGVVVLLGTDTAPAVDREQANLRPAPNFDVKLPLGDDVPRDRFVPGLAAIQIYTPQNDADPEVFLRIDTLARALGSLGTFADERWSPVSPRNIEARTTEKYEAAVEAIEANLEWLGFTPQNVCGAPAGYSFSDLLEPTREWDEGLKTYGGDAIFTTDRLLALHGGHRIVPEDSLDFYVRQAVQTAYDALRVSELSDEIETPQLILCRALLAPAGEVPEYANSLWYFLLTPGIQPRESLLSQGTYHVKEISRNGNLAYVLVCHPTLGSRYIDLAWREAGYRAEVVGNLLDVGCQSDFESRGYIADYEPEDTVRFSFGERSFSVSEVLEFPRG